MVLYPTYLANFTKFMETRLPKDIARITVTYAALSNDEFAFSIVESLVPICLYSPKPIPRQTPEINGTLKIVREEGEFYLIIGDFIRQKFYQQRITREVTDDGLYLRLLVKWPYVPPGQILKTTEMIADLSRQFLELLADSSYGSFI